ncbi:MAG: FliH/SctL family protein [Bacillota bacterium]|nr:FliH/SctL family protein [Bacillota bacterium]
MSKIIKFPHWRLSSPRMVEVSPVEPEEEPEAALPGVAEAQAALEGAAETPAEEGFVRPAPSQTGSNEEAARETAEAAAEVERARAEALREIDLHRQEALRRAEEEAQALLEAARREAEALVEKARAEAEALAAAAREAGRKEGYEAGLAQGREEGLAEIQREAAALVEKAERFLAQALEERKRILEESRDEILKLVLKFAEKIVRSEIRADRGTILRTLEAAIKLVNDHRRVVIRVHPRDLELAREGMGNFLQFFPPSAEVEVRADEAVEPGGCLIETEAGDVDARVETQLAELAEKLEGVI